MSTSVGTLPILQEAQYLRITSSFVVGEGRASEGKMEYIILGAACFVVIVLPFLRWLQLSTSVKAKSA